MAAPGSRLQVPARARLGLLAAGLSVTAAAAPLPGRFGVEASLDFPLGDFAEVRGSGARQGFALGAAHALDLGDSTGFAWVTHMAFLTSPMGGAGIRAALADLDLQVEDVEPGTWFIFPLQGGIRHRVGEGGVFYWQIQAGMDIAAIGGWPGQSPTVESSWSAGFGYALGIGVLALDRLDLGMRFWNLGVHEFSAQIRDRDRTLLRGDGRVEIELLMVDLRIWL